jgi:hypothetical protein
VAGCQSFLPIRRVEAGKHFRSCEIGEPAGVIGVGQEKAVVFGNLWHCCSRLAQRKWSIKRGELRGLFCFDLSYFYPLRRHHKKLVEMVLVLLKYVEEAVVFCAEIS